MKIGGNGWELIERTACMIAGDDFNSVDANRVGRALVGKALLRTGLTSADRETLSEYVLEG